MKTLTLLLLTLASCLSLAQSHENKCSKSLLNLSDWSELSESVLFCLDSSVGFSSAIKDLCLDDRRQISPEYQQYLKYKKEYEDTLAWYQLLPQREQQTAAARYKLRIAKENWETLGLKDAIREILLKLNESFRACGLEG